MNGEAAIIALRAVMEREKDSGGPDEGSWPGLGRDKLEERTEASAAAAFWRWGERLRRLRR